MSKSDKLIRFFLTCPSEASFEDVRRLLEEFDFLAVRTSGSHVIFRHEDGRQITVPTKKGRTVKKVYIRQIIELLSLEDWYDQEDDG